MISPVRWWWRAGIPALLIAFNSACGGGSVPTSTPLFTDDFATTFPGTAWTMPLGAATAAPDLAIGLPAPSLKLSTATASTSVKTSTTTVFNNPSLTISFNMADKSTATSQIGTGTATIFNATPASIAFASWDNATGKITFHINGAVDVLSAVIPADGVFHKLIFSVNSTGSATWTLDNGAALVTQAIPAGMLTLELTATFGTGTVWPTYYFDNINVTSP